MSRSGDTILTACFPPAWEQIRPLREFLTAHTSSASGVETAAVVGMVASELLENAVKYGDVTGVIEIDVTRQPASSEITIEVSNGARPARIDVLQREFDRSRSAVPSEAFCRAVDRLRSLPNGSTMLGLARVMSEVPLELQVDGSRVTLTAHVAPVDRTRNRPWQRERDRSQPQLTPAAEALRATRAGEDDGLDPTAPNTPRRGQS